MYFIKTVHARLRSCLLYGFLLGFCRPVIGPWALQENNALQFISQSEHVLYWLQEQAM